MKIAVMADGRDDNSKVAETFADARWLLIADMDQQCISEVIERNKTEDIDNRRFSQAIVDWNCESVICGEIEKVPFEILADAGVTRSLGNGLVVADALAGESMLDLITDYIGGPGCPSDAPRSDLVEICSCKHDDVD